MELIEKINALIAENSPKVDLRPILPPSKQLAQIIAAYCNSDGGYIILGAKWKPKGGFEVNGISMDFNANAITHKALDYLSPSPIVEYGYQPYNGKQTFVIVVAPSTETILLQGREFIRSGTNIVDKNEVSPIFNPTGDLRIGQTSAHLQALGSTQTFAKSKILMHFQSALKIIDNLAVLLYPDGISQPTTVAEGKILSRILFSSIVDNFEIYLGDLLYEIWLSNPNTLRSGATVTVEQVLKCSDIEEFIIFYAKDKISKMKKGSVKTFIKDNSQISDLNVFTRQKTDEVEAILQIRHLFSHNNGIIDEQFLRYYNGPLSIGDDFVLNIDDFLERLIYLADTIHLLDNAAIARYNLSTL